MACPFKYIFTGIVSLILFVVIDKLFKDWKSSECALRVSGFFNDVKEVFGFKDQKGGEDGEKVEKIIDGGDEDRSEVSASEKD